MSTKAIEKKKKLVDALKEKIGSASVMVLVDYRATTVKEVTELRKKLRADESEYKIIKNTLLLRAMEAAGFEGLKEQLNGPTALLLGYKDPVKPLKTLVNYIEEIEKGAVKAGIFEKKVFDKKGMTQISKLPGKEVLLSQVVGSFQGPLYGIVNVLSGPIRKLVYALNAVREKKGG